jgi:cyclopropane-fatty-acyl-phospholipid synthase
MKPFPPSRKTPPNTPSVQSPLDHLAKLIISRFLLKLQYGCLILQEKGETFTFGEPAGLTNLKARVTVHHPRFYRSLLQAGSRGLGEAYMQGWWSTDDLTAVIRLLARNITFFENSLGKWIRMAGPVYHLMKLPFRNTITGSRSNISAHYDLGNDFYALFLDETMTYSCGIFETEKSTLQEAALAKYERICQKLDLNAGDRVLEIGSGWGGFALHAAGRYGCRVTTTTISRAQHDLALERIKAAGLADRVTLLLKDYRHLEGTYDKLVSIEMIEAVGYEYFDTFFRVCSDRLKEDGLMCLQAITISDRVFDRYRRSYDFIRSHVFPGSCLTSLAAVSASVARVTDLRLVHLEDLTPHYVKTLQHWREGFFANLDKVRTLGYSETFIRMWEFYLCYCEGGFAENYIGDVQMVLSKPQCRISPALPLSS